MRTHRPVLVPHVPAHYYDPRLLSAASVCAHHKRLAANWGRGPTMTGWKFARIRTDVTSNMEIIVYHTEVMFHFVHGLIYWPY